MSSIKWLPLESNPDVMNKFLENLGVPKKWAISDVVSLDEELLSLVPTPVLSVLLLFPVESTDEEFRKKVEDDIKAGKLTVSNKLYFMQQTIRNACGTVALIHALGNNADLFDLKSDSVLAKFLEKTKALTPEQRGKELETADDIESVHEASAQEGQTEPPPADESVNLHFIAFVNVDGQLYELDGRCNVPVIHGSTSDETFLKDTAKVCQEYMKRDPGNMKFSVLALTQAPN